MASLTAKGSALGEYRSVTQLDRAMVALMALVALLSISGCSPQTNGPVQVDGAVGEICLPAPTARDFAYGFNILRNHGTAPITITSITLNAPARIRLLDAFIAPISHDTTFNTDVPWPVQVAKVDPKARSDWEHRVEAIGGDRLASRLPNTTWNLVLHLKSTAARASFRSFTIDYRREGQEYTTTALVALALRPRCS